MANTIVWSQGDAVKVNVLEAPHNVAAPPVYQQVFRPASGQFNKVINNMLHMRLK
jgi:hypothetical protein